MDPADEEQAWIERLRAIASADEDGSAGAADWSTIDPDGVLPDGFRRVFDVYGTGAIDGRPLEGISNRYAHLQLPDPEIDGPALGPDGFAWSWFDGPWRVVGVSRSTVSAWARAPVPDVPLVGGTWLNVYTENERTRDGLVWAPGHDGAAVTLVLSLQRAAVWVLAMPPAEIVVRHLVGLTGCPWMPRPDPGLVDAHGSVVLRGQTVPAPRVEIVTPELLDGAALAAPDQGQARADLDELVGLVPPPAEPRRPDWDRIAALLGGPVRADIRKAWDTYGAGQITCREFGDANYVPDAGLHLLPAKYVHLVDDALGAYDVTDLHGDRPVDELRAVAIGWLDGPEHDLWVYRCGDAHGLAFNDGECVTRLPDSAARTLLHAIHGRAFLAWVDFDVDFERYPVEFVAD